MKFHEKNKIPFPETKTEKQITNNNYYVKSYQEKELNENVKKGEKKRRAPALETRLKSELKYILQAPYWKPALRLLGNLGALRCIHPTLELDRKLWRQVCLMDRCLQGFDHEKKLFHWQMRLEVLIGSLESEYRSWVGKNLQLSVDSVRRLEGLELAKVMVMENLPKCDTPSQVVWLLREYDLGMLILIIVQCERWMRRQLAIFDSVGEC